MKTLIKIIAGILLLLIVLVGGAAFYVTTQFDPNQYKTLITDQVQKTIGRKLTLNGPITLSVFPKIAVSLSDVTLSNADWAGTAPMANIKSLKASLELIPLLSQQIVVDGILLDGATLNLVQQGGQNNWTFAAANQPAPAPATAGKTAANAAVAMPQIQSIEIKDITLNYTANGKATQVTINDAKSALDLSKPVTATIDGKLNQIAFNASITGGTLGEVIANANKWPLKGTAQLAGTKLTFDGNITKPQTFGGANFQISASGDGADTKPITGSALPFGKFDFAAQISMPNAQNASLSGLKFTTGQTSVNGDLKIALVGKPSVNGTIHIPTLNLADFAPKSTAPAPQHSMNIISSAHAADAGVIPAIAIPAAALRGADAKIALDIGQINNGTQNMGAFSSNIDLADSVLRVTPIKLQYGGNTFTGDLTLDGHADAVALTTNINSDNLDYGKLLSELKINDKITGTGALALNFSGNGTDTRQIAANSHGTFKLSSNQGQFDTSVILGQLGGLSNLTSLAGYQVPSTAVLNCASIEFDGTNGVWNSKQSAVDSNVMTVVLTGDVNLAQEQLNMKAAPNLKAAKAQGLAPTLKIAGALTKPTITSDGSSVTQSLLAASKLGNSKVSGMLTSFLGGNKTAGATAVTAPAGSCLAAVQKAALPAASATTATPAATNTSATTGSSKTQQLNNAISGGLKSLLGK